MGPVISCHMLQSTIKPVVVSSKKQKRMNKTGQILVSVPFFCFAEIYQQIVIIIYWHSKNNSANVIQDLLKLLSIWYIAVRQITGHRSNQH